MPVDARVQSFTELTDLTTNDSLVLVRRTTNEGEIIDYSLLADKILEKLSSKTFSSLTTSSKLLPGAINELDANVTSLSEHSLNSGSWINNANLNDYKTPGTYSIGDSPTNAPIDATGSTASWFFLMVTGQGGSTPTIRQLVFSRFNEIAYRTYQSSTWGKWYAMPLNNFGDGFDITFSAVLCGVTSGTAYGFVSMPLTLQTNNYQVTASSKGSIVNIGTPTSIEFTAKYRNGIAFSAKHSSISANTICFLQGATFHVNPATS